MSVPLWLFIPVAALAVIGCFGWLLTLTRTEQRVDRIFNEQTDRRRLNDQTAADKAGEV